MSVNREVEILIVEDSLTQALELQYILEEQKYHVRVARDGVEGLEQARVRRPALVISDVVMPRMDGYQLCSAIKADPALQSIPVILLTSLTDPKDILSGLACGADNFLTKPYEKRHLLSRIAQILANRELRQGSRMEMSVDIFFAGERHRITADRQQIVDLLLSTYETAVQKNNQLLAAQAELRAANESLEGLVAQRTAALQWEIAERTRAQEAIEDARDFYVKLLDDFPNPVWRSGVDGKCDYVNRAWLQFTGRTPEQELGDGWVEGVHPEELDRCLSTYRSAFDAREPFEMEYRLRNGDGDYHWLVDVGRPFAGLNGEFAGYIGSCYDVQDRRSLEEQFRQSQKMEAVGRLAGGIAHDFNNFLVPITLYSELLMRQLDRESPLYRYAEQIAKGADRAAALPRQLLAFSRRQILEPQVLDLNSLLAAMERMLARMIGEDIGLVVNPDPELGHVKADPGQIEQIIMNLAVNARDAMPRGGSLTIETQNVELSEEYARGHLGVVPGRYVMLALSDDGCGMDRETQSHIFEPFFTTKEKDKGTGLGLATVYGIVKQSQGEIRVYSELGRGTTFRIYLPRLAAAEEPNTGRKAEVPVVGGTETILLVEDDENVRAAARVILDMGGYYVLEASCGEDALRISAEHEGIIHVMLTDVVMPGMDGREVAERLAPQRPDMRVLFMSGYTENAIVHHGMLDADTALIQKPFTPVALLRKLRGVLDPR